jgi:hypothetical protein
MTGCSAAFGCSLLNLRGAQIQETEAAGRDAGCFHFLGFCEAKPQAKK